MFCMADTAKTPESTVCEGYPSQASWSTFVVTPGMKPNLTASSRTQISGTASAGGASAITSFHPGHVRRRGRNDTDPVAPQHKRRRVDTIAIAASGDQR
jgi:hypothetical protein